MSLRVAIQMDRLDSIHPPGDSTLRLGIEAQKRGHELFYYTPDGLSCLNGIVTAPGYHVKLYNDMQRHYELGKSLTLNLSDMDVVLLRQDPPFNMQYITSTYMLDLLPEKTLVINNPTSVRDLPEKIFPILFKEFMPPTLVSGNIAEIESFRAQHKDIVIKPLYGYGGRGVFRITENDDNFHSLLEMMFATTREPVMVQTFLPEVKTGDRRIILIDGEVGGVFGRHPAGDEIRANMRVGGKPVKADLTKRQAEICAAIGPMLKEKGLVFVGLDCIGDWLTEINITSPTGLAAMTNLYGVKLEEKIWDAIEAKF